MWFLSHVLILILAFIIGLFGWAAIVGGFQNLRIEGSKMLITIVFWAVILICLFLIVKNNFHNYLKVWKIGMSISFIAIITAGKIR